MFFGLDLHKRKENLLPFSFRGITLTKHKYSGRESLLELFFPETNKNQEEEEDGNENTIMNTFMSELISLLIEENEKTEEATTIAQKCRKRNCMIITFLVLFPPYGMWMLIQVIEDHWYYEE